MYHSSLVPFPSRAGMVLPCALFRTLFGFSHRDALSYSLFCGRGQDSKEVG